MNRKIWLFSLGALFCLCVASSSAFADTVIDDFESGAGKTYSFPWKGNGATGSVLRVSTVSVQGSGNSLEITYNFPNPSPPTSWGVARCVLASYVDITQYNEIQFWLKGDGSTNTIHLELKEDNSVAPYDGETYNSAIDAGDTEHVISLESNEWQLISIPLAQSSTTTWSAGAFLPNPDASLAGAVFSPRVVEYRITVHGTKQATSSKFYIDDITSVTSFPVIDDFEHHNANAVKTGKKQGSSATISTFISTATAYHNNRAFGINYDLQSQNDFVWVLKMLGGQNYAGSGPRCQDWSAYSGITFWLYGDGSANKLTVKADMRGAIIDQWWNDIETYQFEKTDIPLTSGWQQITIAFSDMKRPGNHSPVEQDMKAVKSVSFTIKGGDTGEHKVYIDYLRIGSFSSTGFLPVFTQDEYTGTTQTVYNMRDIFKGNLYRNGDTINLKVYLGQDAIGASQNLSADFSQIDSNYSAYNVQITDEGEGYYKISYQISSNNEYGDRSGLRAILMDSASGAEDDSFVMELDNRIDYATGGVIRESENGAQLYVPPHVLTTNTLDAEIATELDGVTVDAPARNFKPSSTVFAKPATIRIPYTDTDFSENVRLAIFLWNGVNWDKIGGEKKTQVGTKFVQAKVSRLGVYAIMEDVSGTAEQPIEDVKVIPNPFSPNGDGINEFITFNFNTSVNDESALKVSIYDLSGRMVRELEGALNGETYTAVWDGRENGDIANIGLYVYVIRAGDGISRGTIALAK